MSVAPRSRNGFTHNLGRIWGHCEQPEVTASGTFACWNQTMYRCDLCKQFICAAHQREHTQADHRERESRVVKEGQ